MNKSNKISTSIARPTTVAIKKAAGILRHGGIVAFPTETVYGLGANALDPKAVKKIFKAKGRPSDNPLIVHIADRSELSKFVLEIPLVARKLIAKFWPGPLTLVFKKSSAIPAIVSAGLNTVAIRMPRHPVAVALIRAGGVPLAAPSANSSTRPSPTQAMHVYDDLKGKLEMIIDGGSTDIGIESTVLDLTTKIPTILRPGAITEEMLLKILPKIRLAKKIKIAKSPGMKYKHYAPKTPVWLFTGTDDAKRTQQIFRAAFEKNRKKKFCLILNGHSSYLEEQGVFLLGSSHAEVAKNIYHALRRADTYGAHAIIVEGLPEKGMAKAIMNRLRKAAIKLIK